MVKTKFSNANWTDDFYCLPIAEAMDCCGLHCDIPIY